MPQSAVWTPPFITQKLVTSHLDLLNVRQDKRGKCM